MLNQKSGWFQPHLLNPANIEKVVKPQVPGVYVLANLGPKRQILVKHIKSSGTVKQDLEKYLGKFHVFMYKPFRHQLEKLGYNQPQLALRLA